MKKTTVVRVIYTVVLLLLFAPLCFGLSWDNPTVDCNNGTLGDLGTVEITDKTGVVYDTLNTRGMEGQHMTWDQNTLPEGTYDLTPVAVDTSGNKQCGTPTYVHIVIDRTGPGGCTNVK